MKKTLSLLFAGLLFGASEQDLSEAPSWIFTKDNSNCAVGSSVIIDSDVNFAIMEATASARSKIVHQIMEQTVGEKLIKNSSHYEKIEDKIYQIIEGSHLEKMWITKNGKTLYILVEVKKELLNKIDQIFEENIEYKQEEDNTREQ